MFRTDRAVMVGGFVGMRASKDKLPLLVAALMNGLLMDARLSILSAIMSHCGHSQSFLSVHQTYVHNGITVLHTRASDGKKQVEAETTVYTNTAGHTYSTQQLTPHRVPVLMAECSQAHKDACFCFMK